MVDYGKECSEKQTEASHGDSGARRRGQRGVTLVEMAIVMVIIGLLMGSGVVAGRSLIRDMQAKEVLAMVHDLSVSVRYFQEKYHYLPGDLPLARQDILAVSSSCHFSLSVPGIGNGLINEWQGTEGLNSESGCVYDHLFRAGFLSGSEGGLRSRFGPVTLVANRGTRLVSGHSRVELPADVLNVIQFENLPRDIAVMLDREWDDGNLRDGRARADDDPGVEGDPVVAFFAVPL